MIVFFGEKKHNSLAYNNNFNRSFSDVYFGLFSYDSAIYKAVHLDGCAMLNNKLCLCTAAEKFGVEKVLLS